MRNTGPDAWTPVVSLGGSFAFATLVPIGGGELFVDTGRPQRVADSTATPVDEIREIVVEARRAPDGALRVIDHFGRIWKDAGGQRFVAVAAVAPSTTVTAARLIDDADVWAIADTLQHFDGATWSTVSFATSIDLRGATVWAQGLDRVTRFGPAP
jgi:hypothetical protein